MKQKQLFDSKYPIIGMIHLLPTPGYRGHPGEDQVLEYALNDLEFLEKGGVSGVLVENDNDSPHEVEPGKKTIEFMTRVIRGIVKKATVPVGVEVLLNHPKASLEIAKTTGCEFIRTDYFVDRMSRDEYGGEMKIDPIGLMKYKEDNKATDVKIFADVQVKYAELLEKGKSIEESILQAVEHNADGVIVTGDVTGKSPVIKDLKKAKKVSTIPVFIGSGFSAKNAKLLRKYSDGAIVGSSIKKKGFNSPVSEKKVQGLVNLVR